MDIITQAKDPKQFNDNEVNHEKRLSLSASQDSAILPTGDEDAYLKPVDHSKRLSISASRDSAILPTGDEDHYLKSVDHGKSLSLSASQDSTTLPNDDDYLEIIENNPRLAGQKIEHPWLCLNEDDQINHYKGNNPDGHSRLTFENKDCFHISCDDSVYLQVIDKEASRAERINSSITRNAIQSSAHSMCTLDQTLLAVILILQHIKPGNAVSKYKRGNTVSILA